MHLATVIREVTGTAVRAYTHGPRGFHAQTMPGTAFRYGDPNAIYGSVIYGGTASDAVYPLTDALGSAVALYRREPRDTRQPGLYPLRRADPAGRDAGHALSFHGRAA